MIKGTWKLDEYDYTKTMYDILSVVYSNNKSATVVPHEITFFLMCMRRYHRFVTLFPDSGR
jgi:hypothetical protein